MKPIIYPYIIGAGGVTSYLLPCLTKAFDVRNLWLVDSDVLEERNLDRQLFNRRSIGQKKGAALLNTLQIKGRFIDSWFTSEIPVPVFATIIICAADNHAARRAAITAARRNEIPAIIAGNEYYDSQVLMYLPFNAHHEEVDPIQTYPEIGTSEEGNPIRCTGEAQEIHPQLAIANMRAASQVLDMLWLYTTQGKEYTTYHPIEIATTKGGTTHATYADRT